jgi:hypothetical protein
MMLRCLFCDEWASYRTARSETSIHCPTHGWYGISRKQLQGGSARPWAMEMARDLIPIIHRFNRETSRVFMIPDSWIGHPVPDPASSFSEP